MEIFTETKTETMVLYVLNQQEKRYVPFLVCVEMVRGEGIASRKKIIINYLYILRELLSQI